ncbi:probable ATP-dependent DNA helicase HFM1 isoform X1 [Centruroides sculpturatus]|uniref:probable ATP-dependent DNA helicase HFM1 isoform X1 n=1 Tax=Centruroides sculpturatus TaxID=218467 RepID=UPI000C6D0113|nr:probable ATP-dependent DNA helicase HFM1 isoform X1 [Centruroides sculpturatus]
MAKYGLAFETMKQFSKINGSESLYDLIVLLSGCKEFQDILLRSNERKILNTLNKNKTKATIRYPVSGKVNTPQLKINCIIQAALGCLTISEPSLNQDMTKIMKIGQRISKGLAEYLFIEIRGFKALLNAITLAKCFHARLWENSKYVSRQLEKIGAAFSDILVNANITSFQAIEDTNPRELEMILNRNPPFGSYIHDATCHLPKYEICIEQESKTLNNYLDIYVTVMLKNYKLLQEKHTASSNHSCVLLVGDSDDNLILKQRVMDSTLIKMGQLMKKFQIQACKENMELKVYVISEHYVGLDKQITYKLHSGKFHEQKSHINKKNSNPGNSVVSMKKRKPYNNNNNNNKGNIFLNLLISDYFHLLK